MLGIIIIIIDIIVINISENLSEYLEWLADSLHTFPFFPPSVLCKAQQGNHQLEHEGKAILHSSSLQKEILKCQLL